MAAVKMSVKQKVALAWYRNRIHLLYRINAKKAVDTALDLFSTPYKTPPRPEPAVWAKAQHLSLQTNAGKIAGYQWQTGNEKAPTMLVLHGFAGNARAFDYYITDALRQGYNVIAYDAPAHGRSDGKRINAILYAEVIETIIAHHGFFNAFIAHSLGGLSLMLCLHKLSYTTKPKIVLIAPATESTTAVANFFTLLQLKPELRKPFDEAIFERTGRPLEWFSVSRVINEVKGDILWLHDKQDSTTPIADVMPLVQKQPGHVRFHFTSGLGHSRIYRDSSVREVISRFIARS